MAPVALVVADMINDFLDPAGALVCGGGGAGHHSLCGG